jgi:hypothetical protein
MRRTHAWGCSHLGQEMMHQTISLVRRVECIGLVVQEHVAKAFLQCCSHVNVIVSPSMSWLSAARTTAKKAVTEQDLYSVTTFAYTSVYA